MIEVSLSDSVNLRGSVFGFPVRVSATLTAIDGAVEIDLSVSPDLFGVARKKIGDILLQRSEQYPRIKIWKQNGNLRLSVEKIYFRCAFVAEGVMRLEI